MVYLPTVYLADSNRKQVNSTWMLWVLVKRLPTNDHLLIRNDVAFARRFL